MRTGHILILFACLLPLCACSLTFDELPVIEWEVYKVECISRKGDYEEILVWVHPTIDISEDQREFYRDFELTQPLNTNKLVYINGNSLPGEGVGFGIWLPLLIFVQKPLPKQEMSLLLTSLGFL